LATTSRIKASATGERCTSVRLATTAQTWRWSTTKAIRARKATTVPPEASAPPRNRVRLELTRTVIASTTRWTANGARRATPARLGQPLLMATLQPAQRTSTARRGHRRAPSQSAPPEHTTLPLAATLSRTASHALTAHSARKVLALRLARSATTAPNRPTVLMSSRVQKERTGTRLELSTFSSADRAA
jgi:hypothetical protein